MLIFLIHLIHIQAFKSGQAVTADLTLNQTEKIQVDGEGQYIVVYVRPDAENQTLGIIQIGEEKISDYYTTAYIEGSDFNITCIKEPCNTSLYLYKQDAVELDDLQNFQLRKSRPVQLFKISVTKNYQRIIGRFKLSDLAPNVGLQLFNLDDPLIKGNEVEIVFSLTNQNETAFGIISANVRKKSGLNVNGTLFKYLDSFQIEKGEDLEDFLQAKQINTYKIELPKKQFQFLQINILSQFLPRVLLNYDSKPEKIEDYSYDSVITGENIASELSIIIHTADVDGKFIYLSLTGITTQYKIVVSKSNDLPTIHINQLVLGFLSSEDHQYTLRLSNIPQIVVVNAESLNKGDISFKTAECSDSACNSPKKIQQEEQTKIELNPDCPSSKDNLCTYQITIQKSTQNKQAYILGASIQKGDQIIQANRAFSNLINEGEVQQFIVKYDQKKGDTSLLFTISSNNAFYMISNDPNCWPVKSSCALHIGGHENMISLRGKQLKSSKFYVGIYGRSSGYYTFTAQVKNIENENVKLLKEGETYIGLLNPTKQDEEIQYFRIEVDFDEDPLIEIKEKSINPIIELNLHGPKYQLALTVNQGQLLPSTEDFQLISLNNYLEIPPQNERYQRKGVYSIAVEYLEHFKVESEDDMKISFSLTFSTSRTVKTLHTAILHYDEIKPLSQKVYTFFTSLQEENLVLTKHTKSGSIAVSLGDYADNVLFDIGPETSVDIPKSQIEKLCYNDNEKDEDLDLDDKNSNIICQLYVFVNNTTPTLAQFSLTIWIPTIPIEILEGQLHRYNLDDLFKGMKFFFIPLDYKHDIQIHINSLYGDTAYNLQIYDTKNDTAQLCYEDQFKPAHSKSINISSLEECRPRCRIQLEVKANNSDQNIDDTVQVTINQQFIELQAGLQVESMSSYNQPRYFIFNNLKYSDASSLLKITFHELFGKGALCISFSDDENIYMPQRGVCQFKVEGNYVQLNGSQIQDILTNFSLKLNPVMILEVSSNEQVKFSLQLNQDQESDKLSLGTPQRFILQSNQSKKFQFYNYQEEQIQIKLIRLFGPVQFTILECKESCKSLQDDHFTVGQTESLRTLDKCLRCTYKITFEALDQPTEIIFTLTTDKNFIQLQQNVQFTDFLENSKEFNIYQVPFNTDHQIEIKVIEFSGNTQLYVSFNQSLDYKQYQLGPFNRANETNGTNIYEAIIPPREHLEEKSQQYDIIPYNNINHSLASHFNDDDLYILVRSVGHANYSIQIQQSFDQSGFFLQDGLMASLTLSQMIPTGQFYYHNIYDNEPLIYLRVVPYGPLKLEVKNDSNFTTIYPFSQYEDQLIFKLPKLKGLTTLKITNLMTQMQQQQQQIFTKQGNRPINSRFYEYNWNFINRMSIQLSISSKDVILMPLIEEKFGIIQQNEKKFYETYVSEDSKIGLEVYTCSGGLKIMYTQSYKDLIEYQFSSSWEAYQGVPLQVFIIAKKGPLYISTQADSDQQTVFRFKMSQYSIHDIIPHGIISPGSNGEIKYSLEQDNDLIKLNFQGVKCSSCDSNQQQTSKARYIISWAAHEDQLNIIGKCGAQFYNLFNRSNDTLGQEMVGDYFLNQTIIEHTINVGQLNQSPTIYISIVGWLFEFDGKDSQYYIFYSNLEIQVPRNIYFMYKHRITEFIISLSILSIFTFSILCCLCYFYRKARKLKRQKLNLQLENQMNQVKLEKVQDKSEDQKYGQLDEEQDA